MNRSIYVGRSDAGPVKIGIASKPERRLTTLRISSPYPLYLDYSAVVDGNAVGLEASVHADLKQQRLSGEWFEISSHLAVEAIQRAARNLQIGLAVAPPVMRAQGKRGRSVTTGTGKMVNGRWHAADLALLDAFRNQFDPPLPRSTAVRALAEERLMARGHLDRRGLLSA